MNNSYQQGLAELTSLKQQMDGYRPLNKLQVRTLEQQVRSSNTKISITIIFGVNLDVLRTAVPFLVP